MGKGENAGYQHFLLIPQCFLPFAKQISIFQAIFVLSSANAFNLEQFKILSFGKELISDNNIFRLVLIKTICERQTSVAQVIEIVSQTVENTVGEGESAWHHRFLQFSQFSKLFYLTHSHTMTPFEAPGKQAF